MEKEKRSLKIYVTTKNSNKREQRIKEIQEFLLSGFSVNDLMDSRVFPEPYEVAEVFEGVLNLNKCLIGGYC